MNSACFVVMPFGRKPDSMGGEIDFDLVYQQLIQPAVSAAGLDAFRIDENFQGGLIHKTNFTALLKSDFAIFDVTTSNPNVLYELGIRHAMRPKTTIIIANGNARLPFDLNILRVLMYRLNPAGRPDEPGSFSSALGRMLRASETDSPLYALFDALEPPSLEHIRANIPSESSRGLDEWKQRIHEARRSGVDELEDLEAELGDIASAPKSLVLALFDAYRAAGAWEGIIKLASKMDPATASTSGVQELLALALNRTGQSERAEELLLKLLKDKGASGETYGILGRVYKDRWSAARKSGESNAEAQLKKAIDSYVKGFEADWRDPYPGINAVTLMDVSDPPDARLQELLPIVSYAVKRKLESGRGNYWDQATRLELCVLSGDHEGAARTLTAIQAQPTDQWQKATTANNLAFIREQHEKRGEDVEWIRQLEAALARPKE
jgi:hypothetical protein